MRIDKRMRLTAVSLFGVTLGALAALIVLPQARTAIFGGPHEASRTHRSTGIARVGGPFSLTAHTGVRVTDQDFRGHFMIVTFGYVAEPETTPAALQAVTDALDRLGASAGKFQPLFISLDPERDTPQRLAKFIARYDPRFLALTGTRAEIDEAAAAYFVHPVRKTTANAASRYTIGSAAFIYIMDPGGRYLTHFSFATPVADMVAHLRTISRELTGRKPHR